MVASTDLPTTVFPFILRGVSLLGIDSQGISMAIRQQIWSKLAKEWKPAGLESLVFECRLEELNPEIDRILAGGQQGRVVVNLQ
jgi:acrylyl-CoA reductase (NADPH)